MATRPQIPSPTVVPTQTLPASMADVCTFSDGLGATEGVAVAVTGAIVPALRRRLAEVADREHAHRVRQRRPVGVTVAQSTGLVNQTTLQIGAEIVHRHVLAAADFLQRVPI